MRKTFFLNVINFMEKKHILFTHLLKYTLDISLGLKDTSGNTMLLKSHKVVVKSSWLLTIR